MRRLNFLPLVATLPMTAFAGTPDGQTPAEETVCDGYHGAAYGLCVSYCEARDCDDPAKHAADRACAVTEKKFLSLTGLTEMPCTTQGPTCTIDAQDDIYYLNDPGSLPFTVLENDVVTPAGAHATVTAATPTDHVTVTDLANGGFTLAWTGDGAFRESFDYTACCDATTCDTANVTLIGS